MSLPALMPLSGTTLQTERQRAFEDLLAAERTLRVQVEGGLRETRQLLLELAVRFDGARLEAIRREDPSAPANWTPVDWRKFFSSVAFVAGWEQPKSGMAAERAARRQAEEWKARVESLTGQLEEAQQALQIGRLQAVPDTRAVEAAVLAGVNMPEGATPALAVLVADLRQAMPGLPKEPPVAFSRIVTGGGRRGGDRTRAIQRYFAVLYLVGRWRLSARMEAETVLAAVLGVSSGSGSLRRVFEDLARMELLACEMSSLTVPATGLMLCRLTQSGRELYQVLFSGPARENEWERLIRLHEGDALKEHTLAVLAFALHARKRGWGVQVLPEVAGTLAVPDVWVGRGDEAWHVEVERQVKERAPKWRNLAALNNGRAALCAATPEKRSRLVGDCKLANLPGLATDLESLIKNKYASVNEQTPLWLEIWGG